MPEGLKYSIFIGRFQPLHPGHVALIRKVLDEGKPVLVLLRNTPVDANNPWTQAQRREMFRQAFPREFGKSVLVEPLAVDISEVCYGRKVGYELRELRLDNVTEAISGTEMRRKAGKA